MASEQVSTFCRVCEAMCGVMATVEDGRVTKIHSHPDHVHSRGHFCKKAAGMIEVTYDADRVLQPLKRTGGPGEFTPVSWDSALNDIAERLNRIRAMHGPASFATFSGNPPAFSYSTLIGMNNIHAALGVKWKYSVNGDDGAAIVAANHILYGSGSLMAKPDIWRTKFIIVAGANPVVSHGSTISEPLISHALKDVVDRGGRVIVIDPRRTETAQRFDHIPIRAGTDPWFFAALLHEIIALGHVDEAFLAAHTRGFDALSRLLRSCTPEWAEAHCGVAATTIRDLAHDIGKARGEGAIAVHGRTGTCTQRYGTLTNLLMQMVSIVTGGFDRPGGMTFGWGLGNQAAALKHLGIGIGRSRATGLADVGGLLPSTALAADILEPGDEQVRALLMVGANPAMSSAASGPRLDEALRHLELFFAIDLYVNESNRFADYVLPATAMFERDDVPLLTQAWMLRPSFFATPALVEPMGDAQEEWRILDNLCRRMGLGPALPSKPLRWLARLGLPLTPRNFMDLMIRLSPIGDRYGLRRGGVSFAKLLTRYPNGYQACNELPTNVMSQNIATPDKRIDLASPSLVSELERLQGDAIDESSGASYPLRMIGMREVLSHNTWMHNAPSLMTRSREHSIRMHPDDAQARGIADGASVVVRSPYGEIASKAKLTDAMMTGNIAVPHGWGHAGGWRLANASGGANSNLLASGEPADTERIAAMSVLNGIPVEVLLAA